MESKEKNLITKKDNNNKKKRNIAAIHDD